MITTKALGVEIQPSLLARADEVIERPTGLPMTLRNMRATGLEKRSPNGGSLEVRV